MDITSELSKSLNEHLSWNKCRIDCFAKMIVALLTVRTVRLTEWAQVFLTQANPESAYMRIKRFFRYFDLDGDALAKFIFSLFGFSNGQWYLTLDRTTGNLVVLKLIFLFWQLCIRV